MSITRSCWVLRGSGTRSICFTLLRPLEVMDGRWQLMDGCVELHRFCCREMNPQGDLPMFKASLFPNPDQDSQKPLLQPSHSHSPNVPALKGPDHSAHSQASLAASPPQGYCHPQFSQRRIRLFQQDLASRGRLLLVSPIRRRLLCQRF